MDCLYIKKGVVGLLKDSNQVQTDLKDTDDVMTLVSYNSERTL